MHRVLFLLGFLIVGCLSSYAQSRQADSMKLKQYLYNKRIADSLKKKKEEDAFARYKKQNPNVVTYDSKGNKVEKSVGRDGTVTTTTTIIIPPVLNKPFNPDTVIKDSVRIEVYKSKNRMQIMYRGKVLTAYKCVFGPGKGEQKLMEGDRTTPIGIFTILDIRDHEKWEKFMLLDYPNEQSKRIHEDAKAKGQIPASARIGGNVGIHGIWANGDNVIDLKHDWTDGCVGLKNKDVIELSKIVLPGVTKINIRK